MSPAELLSTQLSVGAFSLLGHFLYKYRGSSGRHDGFSVKKSHAEFHFPPHSIRKTL
jgi:hypothetical protein